MNIDVLILCERSGTVREAFRALGFDAVSCDLVAADDGSAHHIVGDALQVRERVRARLHICHPVCTRLANSGALRLYKGGKCTGGRDIGKWAEMERAALFFRSFFMPLADGSRPLLCVENPVQHGHAYEAHACGRPTQIVQPHWFGDDASKATGLWLVGLPPLVATCHVGPRIVTAANGRPYKRWANQTDSGQNRLGPSPDRARIRSVTYAGVARAMAAQWGPLLDT